MLWRVLRFNRANVIFAACFMLRGHDMHNDFFILGCLTFSKVPPTCRSE